MTRYREPSSEQVTCVRCGRKFRRVPGAVSIVTCLPCTIHARLWWAGLDTDPALTLIRDNHRKDTSE